MQKYEAELDAAAEKRREYMISEKFRILGDREELESALIHQRLEQYLSFFELVGQVVSLGLSTTPKKIDWQLNGQIFDAVEDLSKCVDGALEDWINSPDRYI